MVKRFGVFAIWLFMTLGAGAAPAWAQTSLPPSAQDNRAPVDPSEIRWEDVAGTQIILDGGCRRKWMPELIEAEDEIVLSCPRAGYPGKICVLNAVDAQMIFNRLTLVRAGNVGGNAAGRFRFWFIMGDGRKMEVTLPETAQKGLGVNVRFNAQAPLGHLAFEDWLQIRRAAEGACKL